MEEIGKLSINYSACLGLGCYGTRFQGTFEDYMDVTVERVEMRVFTLDISILWQSQGHANILRYFATEKEKDF